MEKQSKEVQKVEPVKAAVHYDGQLNYRITIAEGKMNLEHSEMQVTDIFAVLVTAQRMVQSLEVIAHKNKGQYNHRIRGFIAQTKHILGNMVRKEASNVITALHTWKIEKEEQTQMVAKKRAEEDAAQLIERNKGLAGLMRRIFG